MSKKENVKEFKRPEVVKPGREILVSKEELESIEKINSEINQLIGILGSMRMDYITKEANMSDRLNMRQKMLQETMANLTKKYHIVGRIKGIDMEKCLLILE